MPIWIFLVTIVGGLLGVGAFADRVAKKKKLKFEPEEGIKNASTSQQVYGEDFLRQVNDSFKQPNG
ncbi:hypothetical protein [Priestia koreensis]|uniref:hypothetical protein n=1 Tax=Priestia koreensis TaxID=284581 RepID=UPI001F576476|nr:hypothetical protein [Priestia koreensis]UNL83069.1 hypothetical protein IE339_12775 [Priestia koreensis]